MHISPERERLLNRYGIRAYMPGVQCLKARVFFTISEQEIKECEDVEELEALIQERISQSLEVE